MWVLNIDDDMDDRELFCDAIKDIDPNIDCITKDSAEEAIGLLNKTKSLPNYIFLDINMPKMGGIECLKTIKKSKRLAAIPVIILSTTRNHSEIDEVRRLGADFLAKESLFSKYVIRLRQKLRLNGHNEEFIL